MHGAVKFVRIMTLRLKSGVEMLDILVAAAFNHQQNASA